MSDSGEQHGILDSLKASVTKLGEAAVEGMRENQSMQTGVVDEKRDQAAVHAQDAYDKARDSASDAKDSVQNTNMSDSARGMVHDAKESLKETSFRLQSEAGLEDSKMKEMGAQLAEAGRHAASHLESRLGGGAADSASSDQSRSASSGKGGILGTMTAAMNEDHIRLTGSSAGGAAQ